MPLVNDFNDVLAIDLKFVTVNNRKYTILHLIDAFTRFSAASIVSSKHKEVIVATTMKQWVATFGKPKSLFSDNGGEFNNELLRDVAELLDCKVITTAAFSPWSNGIVERHNAVTESMILKIVHETKCSVENALVWAVSAKNSLHNILSYSPNQLVFGRNPNLPSVLTAKPPALRTVTPSELIAEHLNALHAARKAFIQSELSNKLKTALQRQTRDVTIKVFNNGDNVYYNCPDHKEWRGPGVILGPDGSHVLVRHGGLYVRVSPCHLQKVQDDKICSKNMDPNTTASVTSKPPESSGYDILMIVNPFQLDSALPLEHPDTLLNDEQCDTEDVDSTAIVDSLMHPEITSMSHEPVEEELQGAVIYEHNANDSADNVDCSESDAIYSTSNPTTLDKDADTLQTDETEMPSQLEVESFPKMPKIRDRIQFIDPDTNELNEYLVISRAGKASGIYRHWMNVKNMKNGCIQSVDFDKISQWTPVHEEVMYSAENSQEVLQAQKDELDKWKEYQVYEEVEDAGQDAITTKWVVTEKK